MKRVWTEPAEAGRLTVVCLIHVVMMRGKQGKREEEEQEEREEQEEQEVGKR
jgi:hypothetical protein